MGTLNRKSMDDNCLYRFQDLKLKESLTKPYQFTLACNELSFILRNGYSKFPKNLQSMVFQDTLFSLSLLPQMQMQSAISAANSLLQSAEFVLPKQKKMLAVKEYKHAVVARKRKSKADQEMEGEGLTFLPYDILVHIFGLLDFQSLVSASAICRSWNAAATDEHLWKNLYVAFFCATGYDLKFAGLNTMMKYHEICSPDGGVPEVEISWRFAFKTTYTEMCSSTYYSHRGYCSSCRSIVWVTSSACSDSPCGKDYHNHQIKPILSGQIVDYILDGFLRTDTPYDDCTDSDDDNGVSLTMWAYPTLWD